MKSIPYQRVLLKLSGEALGSDLMILDPTILSKVAQDIAELHKEGIDICLVLGGGNIYRGGEGAKHYHIDRTTSDHMGMLATVINALAFQGVLESLGVECRVMSSISMTSVAEPYIRRRALRHLNKKRIVIFAAGTGNPFFTTDTAAALRASEMECDILLKATKVEGVYCSDPTKNPKAQFFEHLTYEEVLEKKLQVLDRTAVALAFENEIPILVFSLFGEAGLASLLKGTGKRTLISIKEKS